MGCAILTQTMERRHHLGLDAHGRRQWLARLATTPFSVATFVHSYDFTDEEEPTAGNVVLTRRLDDRLLRRVAAHPDVVAKPAA